MWVIYDGHARKIAPMDEKPRLIRWPFEARAELHPENAGRILTQVKELSLHGCYLEFSPLQKGTHVLVKIFVGSDFFEADATVIFSQPNMGLGLGFRDVKPYFSVVLQKCLSEPAKATSLSPETRTPIGDSGLFFLSTPAPGPRVNYSPDTPKHPASP